MMISEALDENTNKCFMNTFFHFIQQQKQTILSFCYFTQISPRFQYLKENTLNKAFCVELIFIRKSSQMIYVLGMPSVIWIPSVFSLRCLCCFNEISEELILSSM